MSSKSSQLVPIDFTPGTQPVTEKTLSSTKHFTYTDKIRYVDGFPQKIGGWLRFVFDYGATITGTVRSILSYYINGKNYTVLGSNSKLYSLIGSSLTNITPLQTGNVAAANSLSTHYATLGANPFAATSGSKMVVVTDSEYNKFKVGDTVTFSGATTFAGIPSGNLNTSTIIRSIGIGNYTIIVATAATSTTSGGGASVVRSSGLVTVTKTAHGQSNGDRVKISGASAFGGITAPQINTEFIIRNVATNTFDIMTSGTATSSVTAAGGAGTVYYPEIPGGALNETLAVGYGAGLYGAGLYGTALVSSSARAYPRIWFGDRYANSIILTPGNQTGLYQWFGSTTTAPVLVTNAPTAINYAFVSNNIIVTFGAAGIENRIFASDFDITVWTSSSTNQVFDDDIEGAGRFISHCPVEDYNLIFTEHKTFTFRYIGLPNVWEIKPLDENIGIISALANESVKGVGFWMGLENFYLYRGGVVEIIPANSQDQTTCLNYVFGDLNFGQKSKIFAWYNKTFNEVWFHYPSAASNECDRAVVVNVLDMTWSIHKIDRTAAEYPTVNLSSPRLINVGNLYQHELGYNDDSSPMPWTATLYKRFYGKSNVNLNQIMPDSIQTGSITFTDKGYLYPQSPVAISTQSTQITTDTGFVPIQSSARFHEYTFSGDDLDQFWNMGVWLEQIQTGSEV